MDFAKKFKNQWENQQITQKDIEAFLNKGMFHDLPKCFYNTEMVNYFSNLCNWIFQNEGNENNKWVKNFFIYFSKSNKNKNSGKWFSSQNKKNNYNKASSPTLFTIHKKNGTKRSIKIPNFQYYFLHIFFFLSLKEEIKSINIKKSLWPIMINSEFNYYKLTNGYNVDITEVTGQEKQFFSEFKSVKVDNNLSWQDWILLKSYEASSLRPYCLKVDIKNFFDSIYTHIFSQEKIINFLKNKIDANFLIENINSIGYKLDQLSSWCNSNETHSIITGPFTSKISSEILLGAIDSEIELQLKENLYEDVEFLHIVDDYYFFSSSSDLTNKLQFLFESILRKFNLSLNENKIHYQHFPYLINYSYMELKAIKNEIKKYKKVDIKCCRSILSLFSNSLGRENGLDIKYLIKAIFGTFNKKINIDNEIAIIFISYLINLMNIRSDLSNCISEQIEKFVNNLKNKVIKDCLLDLLHIHLRKNIEKSYELNTVHVFYLLLIFEDNLSKINAYFETKVSSPFIISMFINFLRTKKIGNLNILKKILNINLYTSQEFKSYENPWNSIWYYPLIEIAKYEKMITSDILNKSTKDKINEFNLYVIDNIEFIKFYK